MNTTATASPDADLMTRHQVAVVFHVTSALIAQWARRGQLREVRDQARRPRYRRADVADLFLRSARTATR
jgi:predicted site-specific integrase-resolvase